MAQSRIRVIVADDEHVFREMLAKHLSEDEGIDVVAVARSGTEALACVREHRPDVALLDVEMPGLSGLELTAIIARECPAVKVVILTGMSQDEILFDALATGASGFLTKNTTLSKVREAIRAVHEGDALLEPSVTVRLIREFTRSRTGRSTPSSRRENDAEEPLTPIETDVLRLVLKGLSDGEIARELEVSPLSVLRHVQCISHKLGVDGRVALIMKAARRGFR